MGWEVGAKIYASDAGLSYIYGLVDPGDGAVRYVGMTIEPATRLNSHLGIDPETAKGRWVEKLREKGVKPYLLILAVVPEAKARATERAWIRKYPGLLNIQRVLSEPLKKRPRLPSPLELEKKKQLVILNSIQKRLEYALQSLHPIKGEALKELKAELAQANKVFQALENRRE